LKRLNFGAAMLDESKRLLSSPELGKSKNCHYSRVENTNTISQGLLFFSGTV
jgi:hypothetical protein